MNPATPTHITNDAILQRLDHEHATAFETGLRLAAADVEANGGDITTLPDDWQPADYVQTPAGEAAEKASHAAWLEFEAIGDVVAHFPAETIEGFASKVRVLARQAQGLPAAELMGMRLATSIVHDALVLYGANFAEPAAATPE